MHHVNINLALAVALLAACTALPPDPDSYDSGDKMEERYFTGCEPQTEVPPKLTSGRVPVYPGIRLMYGQGGYATVAFDVTPEGRVENLTNIESSHPAFYGHTYVVVTEWVFEPAKQNSNPVRVHCEFRQVFDPSRR